MEKLFFILCFILGSYKGICQDLNYDIHTDFKNSISKEKLQSSKTLSDIIPAYPKNWLQDLISVDLTVSNEKSKKHISSNHNLSVQQIAALQKANVWTEVEIHVIYHKKNAITEFLEINVMDFKITVVPDVQAKFEGGIKEVRNIIKDKTSKQLSKSSSKISSIGVFYFTIDESGKIDEVCLENSTNDIETDILLYNTLKNLPQWEPARDKNGKAIKQRFKFILSNANAC